MIYSRVALTWVLVLAGCAGPQVRRELLAQTGSIGVLTVMVDKVGDDPRSIAVMQSVADAAVREYEERLRGAWSWRVVPAEQLAASPDYAGLADWQSSGVVRAELQARSEAGKTQPMELSELVDRQASPYLAATGMPLIPYAALKPYGDRSAGAEYGPADQVRNVIVGSVGRLAAKLGLDALAIVYLHAQIPPRIGAGVIEGERGLDVVKMDPTMMLVTRDGETAIDLGMPVIDGSTTSSAEVPVHRIAYGDAGDHRHPSDGRHFDYVTDLEDPDGKVAAELHALVKRAADEDFASGVREVLADLPPPQSPARVADQGIGTAPAPTAGEALRAEAPITAGAPATVVIDGSAPQATPPSTQAVTAADGAAPSGDAAGKASGDAAATASDAAALTGTVPAETQPADATVSTAGAPEDTGKAPAKKKGKKKKGKGKKKARRGAQS